MAAYLNGEGIEVVGLEGDELLVVQASIDGVLLHRRITTLGPELYAVWQAGNTETALNMLFEPEAVPIALDNEPVDDVLPQDVDGSRITAQMVMDARLQRPRNIDRKRLLQGKYGVNSRGEDLTSKQLMTSVDKMARTEPPFTLWALRPDDERINFTTWSKEHRDQIEQRYGEGSAKQFHNMLRAIEVGMNVFDFHHNDEEPIIRTVLEEERVGIIVLNAQRFLQRLWANIDSFGPKRKIMLLCVADMQREEAVAALDIDTA